MMEYSGLVSEAPDLTLELFVLKHPHLYIGEDGWAFKLISPGALFESGGGGVIICLLLSGV